MEELETCSGDDSGFVAKRVNQIKGWLLSHSQYLNFFTILILASVCYSLLNSSVLLAKSVSNL